MRLLFTGKSNFQYNRDRVLLKGLKGREDVFIEVLPIQKRSRSTSKIIRQKSSEVDFVVVPTFRHRDIAFIKQASEAPVVFDPLVSHYMTRVIDYEVRWKGPSKFIADWRAFSRSDILIWDTLAHQEFLRRKYRLKHPMAPIYIGVDTEIFYPIPQPQKTNTTIVGFYGSFNPLQGIDKIVRAAHILRDKKDIRFRIIGSGSTYKKVHKLSQELRIRNIDFIPNVPYEALNAEINEFDICLGVFGESVKTDVVIPNKIYHYAAARKPIITKDTVGIKEIFTHNDNICLVKNSPEAISQAILRIKDDASLKNSLANKAYETISQHYNQDRIAEMFVNFLKSCT